jgi:hypothetical protein
MLVALPTLAIGPVRLALVVTVPAVRPAAVPVKLVATPEEGVPNAGVINVGDVCKTTAPVPVTPLDKSVADNCLNVGTAVPVVGPANTVLAACVENEPVKVPEVVMGEPVTVNTLEGNPKATLVTVPIPEEVEYTWTTPNSSIEEKAPVDPINRVFFPVEGATGVASFTNIISLISQLLFH